MTTNKGGARLDALVTRLLDHAAADRLTLTATLDLTPDGSGQPPVLKMLGHAAREATAGLESSEAALLDAEIAHLEAEAVDASERGVLGIVWVSQPHEDSDAPSTLLELAAPIRSSLHVGRGPRVFEVARAAFFDRPVTLVTTDLHTMDVTRVRYGAETGSAEVDWPQHYLRKVGQRTGRDAFGGGGPGSNVGHSYSNQQRYVEEQRNLFANEAAEHLAQFVQGDDLLIVEGVEEARAQLLARVPESLSERAVHLPAPQHGEDERDRFERLRALARDAQLAHAAERVEAWASGAEANAIAGIEAILTACEQGRVGSVIVHEDAADHLGSADDARVQESSVDADAVERVLQAALGQGAIAIFTDDERVLAEDGIVAIGRY
jgi:hypothetical protein